MKKLLILGLALFSLTFSASAQQLASCCAKPTANSSASATEAFAMLAADKDFSGGHDAPLPFVFTGEGKEKRSIRTCWPSSPARTSGLTPK